MTENDQKFKVDDASCNANADRSQITASSYSEQLLTSAGFRLRRDQFVRQQTAIRTYSRLRIYENHKTKTELYMQYQCGCPWLRPLKITVIAADRTGLQPLELGSIFNALKQPKLLTVEVALDFSRASGVDRDFVSRHFIFGRSTLIGGRLFKDLRYGTRKSDAMARGYWKAEIERFRVEIEFHSAWLRKHRLTSFDGLPKICIALSRGGIRFVEIDWDLLTAHLSRKGLAAQHLVSQAQSRAHCIHRTLQFLRNEVGLQNVRRFLRPLPINHSVRNVLQMLAKSWRIESESRVGASG